MARFVVVEFRDNEQADAFIAKINAATKQGKRYRVVGLFVPPRIFACKCPLSSGSGSALYKRPPAERGIKYGWWLCGVCGRPRPGGHALTNLLPIDKIFGNRPRGADMIHPSEKINPENYEWKIGNLSIQEVPLDEVGRKKKRWWN